MKASQIWITLHQPGPDDFQVIDRQMTEIGYEPIDEDEGWVEDKGLWQCSFSKMESEDIRGGLCGAHIPGHHSGTCSLPNGHRGECSED